MIIRRWIRPEVIKLGKGKGAMVDCPACGKRVHVAGELISYHPPCPVYEMPPAFP